MGIECPKCKYPRQPYDGGNLDECPACGINYKTSHPGSQHRSEQPRVNPESSFVGGDKKVGNTRGKIQLDCSACKTEQSMKATKIPRFNTILRFIGYIIVIPSVLGVIISIVMFISMGSAASEVMSTAQSDAAATGAAIGATIGFGVSAFVGGSSLVGGVVGWLLLMKKNVYRCLNCEYILDRA